jgi:hypothetical protein
LIRQKPAHIHPAEDAMTKSSCAVTARAVGCLVALLAGAGEAQSAVIPVTTAKQKIGSSGGCSLQEAIFCPGDGRFNRQGRITPLPLTSSPG